MRKFKIFIFSGIFLICCIVPADIIAQDPEEVVIGKLREQSNIAIAERALAGLRATWVKDIHVTSSSGLVYSNSEEMAAAFTASFNDPEFVTYLRIPADIKISQGASFAAESGQWRGTWNKSDGMMNLSGVYLAQWQKRMSGWLIRSEVFIALSCSGSSECKNIR